MLAHAGESYLDRSRPLETDGLLQFSDVYGQLDGRCFIDDADAIIESAVGNSGRFPNAELRVDAWPDAMTYLASHIVRVRDHQINRLHDDLERLGLDRGAPVNDFLIEELRKKDRKIADRAHSAGRCVVEVVLNHAPRTSEHAACTDNGIIFYSQAPYLRDLQREGRILELHKVKNTANAGLWEDGYWFRSAEVANTRGNPPSRELVYSYRDSDEFRQAIEDGRHEHTVDEQGAPIRVVWVDKFGNAVLRFREPEQYSDLLVPDKKLALVIEGREEEVVVGNNLDDAPTGRLTLFKNPRAHHASYAELAIKTDNCLSPSRDSALAFLRKATLGRRKSAAALRDLRTLEVDLKG